MSRKAVDVALLPSEAMMDRVIKVNAELVEKFSKKIVLNKENCLPHISLAMGCVAERDIADIEKVLEGITKESSVGNLRVLGIATSANSAGEKVLVLAVEKTDELQSLHEKVTDKLTGYLSYDVTSDMICGGEEIAESTLLWIKNYREKSSFANFSPHITIGYGEIVNGPFPIEFAVSKLALCHLGNHCTCRKILASYEVRSAK